jgi:intein/homing endonuclease
MSNREMAVYLGRTNSSVENKKGRLGLKGERKYQYDYDFFSSPLTEYSAYWIGFIAADGYVSDDGKAVGITLKKDDFEHLKKFNKCLGGNIPTTFRTRKSSDYNGKTFPVREQCTIRIYNKEMVKDLNAYGIVPRKSLVLKFNNFESDYLTWCYIRGYFDGDGSVYYDKRSNQLRTKITSGSLDFRKSFCEFLNKFGIKTYMTGQGEGLDCGITGKESTRIFLSKMYDNSSIHLDRKYKKYQNYKCLWLQ